MHIKQSLLRAATAAAVTSLLTLGSGLPAQATTTDDDGTTTTQSGAGQAEAEDNQTSAAQKKGAGTENQPEDEDTDATTEDDAEETVEGEDAAEADETDEAADADDADDAAAETEDSDEDAGETKAASGNAEDKAENGAGHTPVTVCHHLGNDGYIVITFDENALEKHLENHGDIYPVPAEGCPETEEEAAAIVADTTAAAAEQVVDSLQVLGVQAERATPEVLAGRAAANRAPAAVASGILPATGAGDYLWVVLGGLGLLGAGGALLARRRLQG
jgi:LPXTG-motif cell wall-anchored protein